MVFESVVADVLNRVLGDYVENLNRNQLKIGIWGGDVVLENLILKDNALDQLDLPVQVVFGHLGKLVLKIPWKNLYGASVEASIEKLFIIANPLSDIEYDSVKDEKNKFEKKMAELKRIEEAKNKEKETDVKVDDSFVEKLSTQIIKNVQLNIKDIHIRYEDRVTNPKAPFSVGITLHNLSVQTTDSEWVPTFAQETVTKIYKVLDLEGLALYWNTSDKMLAKTERTGLKTILENEIATKTKTPKNYHYFLGPINAKATLVLNPKPEADEPKFSTPKVVLSLHMEELMLAINKGQYQDILKLADSLSRLSKAAPFRKYRPNVPTYRGYYKEWWKFAYKCVLEEDIRRRRRNWDWNYMRTHRHLCKEYALAYQAQLCQNKVSSDTQLLLNNCEKKIDLFNLVIIRQRIELEVERLGKKAEEEKKGWFSSWWGGSSKSEINVNKETDYIKKLEDAMTPEEKAKLFRAIDYHENSAPLHLPIEFQAIKCNFLLDTLALVVSDDGKKVLNASVDEVSVDFVLRPSASAIMVGVKMRDFQVCGVEREEFKPRLVRRKPGSEGAALLFVAFETKPLELKCDQKVLVRAQPLQIVFDAETVIQLVNVFKLPHESSALERLQLAAENQISNLKEKSTLGMQYAVEKHAFVDVDIEMQSSYLIIPHSGVFHGKESCLVMNLGSISVKSEGRNESTLNVSKMFSEGRCDEDILEQIMAQTYDKFHIRLTDIQVVIANQDDNWIGAITNKVGTPIHLLQPTTLKIEIHKCLVSDDPRLPHVRIQAQLNEITVNASEQRLLTMFEIMISLPLPQSDANAAPLKRSESRGSNLSLRKYLENAEIKRREVSKSADLDAEMTQLTKVDACFVLNKFTLHVASSRGRTLDFDLIGLELSFKQKSFQQEALIRLSSIALTHNRPGLDVVQIVETPRESFNSDGENEVVYLFTIKYTDVDKSSPDFKSRHLCVEKLIELDFKTLKILLHLESIKDTLFIANEFQVRVQNMQGGKEVSAGELLETINEEEGSPSTITKWTSSGKEKYIKKKKVDSVKMKVKVNVGAVDIQFKTESKELADVYLHGMKAGLIVKESHTQVDVTMEDIRVIDLNPLSKHKEILKVVGGNVMTIRLVLFDLEKFPDVSEAQMTIECQFNCLKIFYLNWFVQSMLKFLDNFQTAQEAIMKASKQTADAAKANVQNAYENQTKISLNISLNAPIIVIPQSSTSNDAVLLDLGQIQIRNTFNEHPIENSSKKVTVDEITLSLENLKVVRVFLSSSGEQESDQNTILKPINMKLSIKRNLSLWYGSIPNIDVFGHLKTVEITASDDDMKMILSITSGNLTEGNEEPKASNKKRLNRTPSTMSNKMKQTKSGQIVKKKVSESALNEIQRAAVKFKFLLDSIVINLLETVTPERSRTRSIMSKHCGLAQLCFKLFTVKGRILTNGVMHTTVRLIEIILDDLRPMRENKISRYIESSEHEVGDADDQVGKSMIDITYTQSNNDTFVDIRILSFNLILALDFLMRVAEFFKKSPAVPLNTSSSTLQQQVLTQQKKKVSFEPVEEKTLSMLTLNIKLEKPDIILVESFDDKDCEALVLNTEIIFNMRQRADVTVLNGSIGDFQLYRRANKKIDSYLLEPCNLSLQVSQPENRGMNVDLAVTDVQINVSPDTLSLLNRVLVTLTYKEDEQTTAVNEPIIYNDLWSPKPFSPSAHWFMNAEEASDALDVEESDYVGWEKSANQPLNEICLFGCPSVTLALKLGVGEDTITLLILSAAVQAHITNWSTELNVESSVTAQASYYNISKALWEPLLEPVEILHDNVYKHIPWEVRIDVRMRRDVDTLDGNSSNVEAVTKALHEQKPPLSVEITSEYAMELTITSTWLNVLKDIQAAYTAAMTVDAPLAVKSATRSSLAAPKKTVRVKAPFILHNDTGVAIELILEQQGDFSLYSEFLSADNAVEGDKVILLESGAEEYLQQKHGGISKLKLNEPPPTYTVKIRLETYDMVISLPVEKSDERLFSLQRGNRAAETLLNFDTLKSEVVFEDGSIHVYLSSCIKITNDLFLPISVLYMQRGGVELQVVGTIEPGETHRLPIQAAHTQRSEIYFKVKDYLVSATPFVWRGLDKENLLKKLIECEPADKNSKNVFFMTVIGRSKDIFVEASKHRSPLAKAFHLTVKPALSLQNCLPYPLTLHTTTEERKLLPGELAELIQFRPYKDTLTLTLDNYLEKCWSCMIEVPNDETELSVQSFDSHDSPEKMTLELGLQNINVDGTQQLSLYCPFWMLNKTGLTLSYRTEYDTNHILFHPADYSATPILFSFRAKHFFGKKKASVRVDFGEWSDKFSLDTAGSNGVVICNTENKKYTLGVANRLTFNSLTKMVVFTPFFLIMNNAPFAVEYQEVHRSADPWIKVESGSSEAFWPATDRLEKLLLLRVFGSKHHCKAFSYTTQHSTTLELDDKYGGLNVEINLSESYSLITIKQYQPDTAPALLINHTGSPISYYEKDNVNIRNLEPGHQVLFTWANPSGSRVLAFQCKKHKEIENNLRKDDIGEIILSDDSEGFWVSFLEGHQRIIFFTSDTTLAQCAITRGMVGKILSVMKLSLHSVGLSLVDDARALEIMYISISSSGIIWETCKMKGRRYKRLPEEKAVLLEEAYQRYANECVVANAVLPGVVQIDPKTQVDFTQNIQIKPTQRVLRRTLEAGVFLMMGTLDNSRRFHMKLHKIQIDQNVPDSVFPVLLAAVPPPKSVAAAQDPKPFVEVSIVERINPHSTVKQYNYFRVLIQEFHVKVDMTFINALVEMFPQKTITQEEALELFEADLLMTTTTLSELSAQEVVNDQRHFYENLHLSPIKVHISFSLGGSTQLPTFIGTVLQGIGFTLTDMNDVVLKLGYYEREYEFLSQRELIAQVQKHYMVQSLQQLYVLVLGLDVLGNPYGLVLGLKQGVEDLFYEPFQGLIQGPGEFAEGLALGVRSLGAHVVGGAAGAVAKITGAVGTGLAALSLDSDYQAARRQTRAARPGTIQEGLAQSGKGLFMGVYDGVTGVFTKPVEGAMSGGVEGFFKGLGKGAAGLVARPTAGVVDFASGSFDAVKRATDLMQAVVQLRDTRLLSKDEGVEPYSRSKAAGYKLLKQIDKGKYLETDRYVCHEMCAGDKEGILCTDKRIIYIQKSNVFGVAQVEWSYAWKDLPDCPMLTERGIFIPLPQKKMLGVFSKSSSGKIIPIIDEAKRKYIFTKCRDLYNGRH